jgi:hypothetical protein
MHPSILDVRAMLQPAFDILRSKDIAARQSDQVLDPVDEDQL